MIRSSTATFRHARNGDATRLGRASSREKMPSATIPTILRRRPPNVSRSSTSSRSSLCEAQPVELNSDFSDLLRAFSNGGVEFLVVGAHALSVHDRPRATKDLDVWIKPTPENARRTWHALAAFGAPMDSLTVEDLTDEETVFQIGIAPIRVDVLTSITGVLFDDAWPNRIEVERDGILVPVIGAEDFLTNKEATGRDQDRVDAARVRKRLSRDTP